MEKSSKVNLAIFSAGLMTFIGILNETSMNVTYPLLVKEFHQPLATVQWITTAYLLKQVTGVYAFEHDERHQSRTCR